MPDSVVPYEDDNVRAYRLMLRIEVALRELVSQAYEQKYDRNWQKSLPGPFLSKIRESQRQENQPRFGFARLGPLYYLTFGELCELLRQSTGGNAVALLGGESFVAQLDALFGPRNAVAHGRPVPASAMALIEGLYLQMETALTEEGLSHLVCSPSIGVFPEETRPVLAAWLHEADLAFSRLDRECPVEPLYRTCGRQFWWGETELAGFDCQVVDAAAKAIDGYNALPKGLGSAIDRQHYLMDQDCRNKLALAYAALGQEEVSRGD